MTPKLKDPGEVLAWENTYHEKHEPAEAPLIPYAIPARRIRHTDSPTHVPFGPCRGVMVAACPCRSPSVPSSPRSWRRTWRTGVSTSIASSPLTPALVNAVFDATGIRVRELPLARQDFSDWG